MYVNRTDVSDHRSRVSDLDLDFKDQIIQIQDTESRPGLGYNSKPELVPPTHLLKSD